MRAELRAPPIKINELVQANERTSGVHPLSNDSVLSLQRERDLLYFATLMQFMWVHLKQSVLYECDSCRLYRAVFVYAFIHFSFSDHFDQLG